MVAITLMSEAAFKVLFLLVILEPLLKCLLRQGLANMVALRKASAQLAQ